MKQKLYQLVIRIICFTTIQFFSQNFLLASQEKLVIAHRGASGYLPEHTFAGAVMAYSLGADYLELDVLLTKDGHLIVMHDLTLNAMTNVEKVFPHRSRSKGKHLALDFTLEEIKQLRIHERSAKRGTGPAFPKRFPIGSAIFEVPTVEEMILLLKGLSRSHGRVMGLYIEIKGAEFHRRHQLDPVKSLLDLLERHGYREASDPIWIQSFDSRVLKSLRHEHKTRLKLVQLIGENRWHISPNDFNSMKTEDGLREVAGYADGIGPWINQVVIGASFSGQIHLTGLVQQAQRMNLKVHPYTLRADSLPSYASTFEELLNIFFKKVKVDGVITDFPDQVVEYLQSTFLH